MTTIDKSIFIDAPVARVFEYVNDPNNMPAVFPSLIEVKKVKTRADDTREFDWVYKMAGIRFEGHAETTELKRNERLVLENEGGIASTFSYRFEPKNNGTQLSLTIKYDLPGKVLKKLAEPILVKLNEREAESLLHNVKTTMEHAAVRAAE